MESTNILIKKLIKRNISIALAESCSGGYASYILTKTPGASKVFKGGIVVYSLDTKAKLFKLPISILNKTKGVSKEIAATLADKVRHKLKSDIGASIVGFAGPGGKKIGSVIIGLSYENKIIAIESMIKGNRDIVRKKASNLLIQLAYKII